MMATIIIDIQDATGASPLFNLHILPSYSRTYTALKGTLFDVVLLMWVNGRLLFLSTFCQGRRFDSVHQHCLFFNISTGKFAIYLSSVGALLISYPCVNSGKSVCATPPLRYYQ